ncbi:MAG: hypothetical protein EA401_14710 [Planctomycetota bacterium]|nr:MAG: hypothetical protein EA401_14710 [Planctomycetota bacterium]
MTTNQQPSSTRSIPLLTIGALFCIGLTAQLYSEESASASPNDAGQWTYRSAHNYVAPLEEGVQLTSNPLEVRPQWEYEIHTGINSSSAGPARNLLGQGISPTYGETAAAVVVDGVYILSWSEATGPSARPESLTDRYHRGEENYAALKDTYYRIDANWNTIALDADTGEKLWLVSRPSASINFQSSKRSHNGIDPVAGNGLYITTSILGRVFAYDIASGELRWETTVGAFNEQAEAFKAESLEQRNLPVVSDGPFGTMRSGGTMVGNAAILSDLRGGLIALDIEDGSVLWQIEDSVMHRQGNPRQWQHEGATYLMTHSNDRVVYLINPSDGSIIWQHDTGHNPGKLIIGDDYVMLNPERDDPGLLAAYRISLEGLEQLWRFPDIQDDRTFKNHVHLGGSRGAERKGLIENGRLYIALGHPYKQQARRFGVFDMETGEELYRSDYTIVGSVAAPVSYGDKLYWQITNSSAENAGIYIYQKHDDGRMERMGEVRYRTLGSLLTTDYSHPTDRPFANGRTYLRGRTNIIALDLREPMHPSAPFTMSSGWTGFVRPVQGLMIPDADNRIDVARVEVPPRSELGVPGTTARRTDVWSHIEFPEPLPMGKAWETTAIVHMAIFSWPAQIVMQEAEGNQWRGTWTRSFPGWEETMSLSGNIHESSQGGIPGRGWLTPWLDDRPISMYSDLEDGQQRVVMNIFDSLPLENGDLQNMTLALDHDGEKVVSAVVGGFRFNQSYHEVDPAGLEVSENGITGSARVILNGDPWLHDTDWKNGGSLMGHLTLDVQFGEANDDGLHPVSGEWTLEWGMADEIMGSIDITLGE